MIDLSVTQHMPITAGLPAPARDWALFLDLDGTLLDIAPTPDAVIVPPDLVTDLTSVSKALGGALAIVSGRGLDTIDSLLAPLRLPVGSEHGALVRLPNGAYDEVELKVPEDWKTALHDLVAACPGVLAEIKSHNIVAHYRNAPSHEEDVRRLINRLVACDPQNFALLEAKMAFEILPRQVTKGHVVDCLMNVEPFRGRIPVFIGDDITDEDGFAAAIKLGGIALHVASSFAGRPSEVRHWLKRFTDL